MTHRLGRIVRNTAKLCGKQVELILEGAWAEVDQDLLEDMSEPMLHLLRNAIDHGLETAEERVAAGKPAIGTIRVRAATEGAATVICVSDDGRGINLDEVRANAIRSGFATQETAATMSTTELCGLLFKPGFSTTSQITEMSGRGLGLDIVQAHIQRRGGRITVESAPGCGTSLVMRLPLMPAAIA